MGWRTEYLNLDGLGRRQTRVYDLPLIDEQDYWINVTDISCPVCHKGLVRWAEAGYVAGYRICEKCKRHFLAKGDTSNPQLVRVGQRRG